MAFVFFAGLAACETTFRGTMLSADPGDTEEPESPSPPRNEPRDELDDAGAEVLVPTPIDDDDAAIPLIVDASTIDATIDASAKTDASTGPEYTIAANGTYSINNTPVACSGSGDPADLYLLNDGKTSYRATWVRPNCTEQDFGVIPPGKQDKHRTYATQRWRLRRTSDNRLIVDFTLQTASDFTVTVH